MANHAGVPVSTLMSFWKEGDMFWAHIPSLDDLDG